MLVSARLYNTQNPWGGAGTAACGAHALQGCALRACWCWRNKTLCLINTAAVTVL